MAFKSGSASMDSAFRGGVDGGLYDPYTRLSLSARSARTANKSIAAGSGSFGAKARREGVRAMGPSVDDGNPSPLTCALDGHIYVYIHCS